MASDSAAVLVLSQPGTLHLRTSTTNSQVKPQAMRRLWPPSARPRAERHVTQGALRLWLEPVPPRSCRGSLPPCYRAAAMTSAGGHMADASCPTHQVHPHARGDGTGIPARRRVWSRLGRRRRRMTGQATQRNTRSGDLDGRRARASADFPIPGHYEGPSGHDMSAGSRAAVACSRCAALVCPHTCPVAIPFPVLHLDARKHERRRQSVIPCSRSFLSRQGG